MVSSKKDNAKQAETLAKLHLISQGLTFLASNFYSRFGEVDLIFLEEEILVFVEVRLRKRGALVSAIQSVDSWKQRKLIKTALSYLSQYHQEDNFPQVRFDVVALDAVDSNANLQWIRSAFDADGFEF